MIMYNVFGKGGPNLYGNYYLHSYMTLYVNDDLTFVLLINRIGFSSHDTSVLCKMFFARR